MAYRLKSQRPGFSVTFLCPTAIVALTQLKRARTLDYPTVAVLDDAGRPVSEAELLAAIPRRDGAACVPEPVERAPAR